MARQLRFLSRCRIARQGARHSLHPAPRTAVPQEREGSRLTAFVAAALMAAATLTVVTQTAGPAGAETFSGPNGRIAYVAGGIWTMDPDKTDPQYLGGGTWPNWSPDGHQIAFAFRAPGTPTSRCG